MSYGSIPLGRLVEVDGSSEGSGHGLTPKRPEDCPYMGYSCVGTSGDSLCGGFCGEADLGKLGNVQPGLQRFIVCSEPLKGH
jgi:hypothetical protein